MTMFTPLASAMIKGFLRDRTALVVQFLLPLMFLVIFGLLMGDTGSGKVKIGVTGDGPVVSALEQSGTVEFVRVAGADEGEARVRDGDLPAVLVAGGDTTRLVYSASAGSQANTALAVVSGTIDKLNIAGSGAAPRFGLTTSTVEDASLKPIQYLTPGVLSWSVSITGVFGAALTLVAWRKKQVLRRLRLAPVRPSFVLGSRIVVAIGTALVQAVAFVALATTPMFGLRLTGQWWLAIPLLVLGTIAFFSIGMLVGALCRSEEAASAVSNLLVLPMSFLSGSFFPMDDAPAWMQRLSQVFPLRHMNDGMLDVLVRGKGAEALLVPSAVLVAFTLVVGLAAVKLFRWEE